MRCTKERRLEYIKSFPNALDHLFIGSDVFHMNVKLLSQIRSVDTIGIELWISSVQLIPWLTVMFFFARSLRIHILFEPILIFASYFTGSICETMSVMSSFFENSICCHVRSNLFKFAWAISYFSGKFRTVLSSSQVLLHYHCFHEAWYVCARRGMLLLALPILFQCYPWYRPWSFKPFEINSFSILRCHTISTISRYRSVGHDCTWLRLPQFQSLILRLWQSYPIHCILVTLPFRNIWCFLSNCEVFMRLLFLRIISKTIRWC